MIPPPIRVLLIRFLLSTPIKQSKSGQYLCEGSRGGNNCVRVIRRCQPAVYRVWLKGMTGTYPTYAYLKRVELAGSSDCPYCDTGVSKTLTHFACVYPQFREVLTSTYNQVRNVISSYLVRWVGPKWTVHKETQMGNMGLILSKVAATKVVDVAKSSGVDAAGECDLQKKQSY